MGFKLKEICMADYLPGQIGSLKDNPEADAAVREVFKKMMVWELTVTENTAAGTCGYDHSTGAAEELSERRGRYQRDPHGYKPHAICVLCRTARFSDDVQVA